MIATEKIVCDSSQEKRGSHPVQGHVGKCQGQLRGEEARGKHGQKPLFRFSKEVFSRLTRMLQSRLLFQSYSSPGSGHVLQVFIG